MTCKDCIHYDVCHRRINSIDFLPVINGKIGKSPVMFKNCDDVETHCKHFKDKSKYIELPCKVGDTVYSVCRKGGKPYIKEEIVKSIYCDVRETLNFVVLNPNNKILKANLFFTKSEAEQKLKELKENA